MMTRYELKTWVLEDIKYRLENEGQWKPEDKIYEAIQYFIECGIPVYNNHLLEVALSNLWLACSEPDLEVPKWEWNPCELIACNIYEFLQEEVYDRYNKNKK